MRCECRKGGASAALSASQESPARHHHYFTASKDEPSLFPVVEPLRSIGVLDLPIFVLTAVLMQRGGGRVERNLSGGSQVAASEEPTMPNACPHRTVKLDEKRGDANDNSQGKHLFHENID